MGKKVRFGIIGTGAIAALHAQAIKLLDTAELVAVFDTVAERSQAFGEKFGAAIFTDFAEFLANPDMDAVTIATPTGAHMDVAIPAARAGKHILCEKPLDVNLTKTDTIIDECEKNKVLLSAVFQSRFNHNVELIKQAYIAGRFGQVVLASTQVKWYRSQQYYDSAGWRGTWQLDGGGALMNQAIHTVDLLLYLNGDADEVFAYGGTLSHERIEVEDNICATIKYKNGSLGVIEVSTSCAPGFARRLEISGTGGSVVLEENRLARWKFVEERLGDKEIEENCGIPEDNSSGAGNPISGVSPEGHRRQISDLVDAIQSGKQLAMPGKEGRRAVQLICSIYESMRTGKPVKLA
jgi:predicted dehydrogenase